ncbi:hypothetical protein IWW38_002964, partial [Coemansia aciculifera]
MDDIHRNIDNNDHLVLTQLLLLSNPQASKNNITTTTLKWERLRSHYPPKHPDFAPIDSAATTRDDYDIALSQAATMIAYAIDWLRLATDPQKVDRRRIQQTDDLLTTLCDMLITTRNEH